ncbi:hypothetical protein [Streptomyces sp. NPDC058694]|uniref:hypothetical protein n=1 Tax=Streptomyces sp. NPDC058694 TaxID=3346603 RepID=UPI0036478087
MHTELDTLVVAPYAQRDGGVAPSRRKPQAAHLITGPWAEILQRLPVLRRAIRRNRAAGGEESDCHPITTASSR